MKKGLSVKSEYVRFLSGIEEILSDARRQAARSVNVVLVATYWEMGRRIVEYEQKGEKRVGYGEEILRCLSSDLTARFGRGFSVDNLELMRRFYLPWGPEKIPETLSRNSACLPDRRISETASRKLNLSFLAKALPLPWSHYSRLIRLENGYARDFYEKESLRGGWSVRQLDRRKKRLRGR